MWSATAGSALASGTNAANSISVLDIPMDRTTMPPVGDGMPALSRGSTPATATAKPAARWDAGMTLVSPG